MNKVEYVAALRELADFVERKPFPDTKTSVWRNEPVALFDAPTLSMHVESAPEFGAICAAIGTFEKDRNEYSTGAIAKLSAGARVSVHTARQNVCKKIVVGTRVVPATEERVIEAEPEHEEEIVEWECPESFVALKEGN
jgi:hypothetical protein